MNKMPSSNSSNPAIHLYLSRSTYALGSSVVGTVTIDYESNSSEEDLHDDDDNDGDNCFVLPPPTPTLPSPSPSLKNNGNQLFSSLKVYVAGRCRVDSRWHSNDTQESITKLYDGHPCHAELPSFVEEEVVDCYFKKSGSSIGNSNTFSTSSTSGGVILGVENSGSLKYEEVGHGHGQRNSVVHGSSSLSSNNQEKKMKKRKHTTFCHWSTNVLTLNNDIPIYHDTSNDKEYHPQTLKMKDSEWFNLGTKIAELDLNEFRGFDDLAYDDDDDDDEDDEDDEEEYEDDDEEEYEDEDEDEGHESIFDDEYNSDNSDAHISKNESREYGMNNSVDSDASISNHDSHALEINGNGNHEIQISTPPTTTTISTTTTTTTMTKKTALMNYTFAANLSSDLPPTANAASVRYFYSVILVAQSLDGQIQIFQAPFTVVTPKATMMDNMNVSSKQQTKIRIGTIDAVAHPTSYPISLSSTYVAEPWCTSVQRVNGGWDHTNVRSIMMEENGYKCAILTIIGGVIMVPGEKILLHFEFVQDDESVVSDDGNTCTVKRENLECHMVSACLQGEEVAIGMDGSQKKTRSYVFDTAYTEIDPFCTRSVSLNLSLPMDCPISLNTDLVKIDVNCRVDMTVNMPNSDSFKFLTVQFPCQVVNDSIFDQPEVNDDSRLSNKIVSQIIKHRRTSENIRGCNKVICPELLDDLSMLSTCILQKTNQ